MAKEKAVRMTDASEVARIMSPLVEQRIPMQVDRQILEETRMMVGEVVAGMIDSGVVFIAPFPELVVKTVALEVGRRLMGIAMNGMQDAVAYAALAVAMGVPGVSFAIMPVGAGALSIPGAGVAGVEASAAEAKPDLSVPDAIDALLADILAAKKPVDDVATLEFLIEKSVEKGNVEAEIFLLEQLVAKLDGGRGVITRLRRLVELTVGRDVQRAIGYLQQIRAIYSAKGAKNAAKNIEGVDGEIAALGEKLAEAEAQVATVADGATLEHVDGGGQVPSRGVPGDGFGEVGERGKGQVASRAVSKDGIVRGNGSDGVAVAVEMAAPGDEVALIEVSAAPVEAPAAPVGPTDDLDEKHCPKIAGALRNINSLEFDAVKDMVQVAISENDGEAILVFRNRLVKASGNSHNVFALISANLAVVDILVAARLYQEAIQHQRRAAELRRNFKRDLAGKIEQRVIDEKLVQLLIDVARSGDRSLRGGDDGGGGEGNDGGEPDDQIAMFGRRRAGSRGAAGDLRDIRAGRVVESAPDARRRRTMRDNGSSGGEAAAGGRERGNGFARAVNAIMDAFSNQNQAALDLSVQSLLDSPFAMSTSKDLRAANIAAANFFESVEEYERSVRHWQKVLELQEAHPLAANPDSQHYIGRTRANLERVRARCPQVF